MRPIFMLLLACSLAHIASAAGGDGNLPAIIRFVEAHCLDMPNMPNTHVSDPEAVLGASEDRYVFRVARGIAALQQKVEKNPVGKGWTYDATLRHFSSLERSEAKSYAAHVWEKLQPIFKAQGFQLRNGNPWDTFTMVKPAACGVIQVWLDYSERPDGTRITLRVSPNVG